MFSLRKSRAKYLIYYLFLVLAVIIYSLIIRVDYSFYTKENIKEFGFISLCLFLCGILCWYKINKSLISAYLIYFIVAYVYWYGQVFLYTFNILGDFGILQDFDIDSLANSLIYSNIGYGLMHLGALLITYRHKGDTVINLAAIRDKKVKEVVRLVSVIMLVISAPIYIYIKIDYLTTSLIYGYNQIYVNSALRESSAFSNIVSSLEMFFIPGLFLFLTAYKDNKKIRLFVLFTSAIILLSDYVSGGRSGATSLVVALVWYWHVQIKSFKKGQALKLIIFGLLLLVGMSLTSEFRGMSNKSLEAFSEVAHNVLENNPIKDMIIEMGYSIFPLVKTMEIVPELYGYGYGFTYLSSTMAIIPSFLFGGYSFASNAALANWLMESLNMNYGPGYSMIAETYYNFGWFGLIAMFFIGILLATVFINKNKSSDAQIIRNTFIAICIYMLILTTRGSALLTIRNLFYGVILPIVAIKLLLTKMNRK